MKRLSALPGTIGSLIVATNVAALYTACLPPPRFRSGEGHVTASGSPSLHDGTIRASSSRQVQQGYSGDRRDDGTDAGGRNRGPRCPAGTESPSAGQSWECVSGRIDMSGLRCAATLASRTRFPSVQDMGVTPAHVSVMTGAVLVFVTRPANPTHRESAQESRLSPFWVEKRILSTARAPSAPW